MKYIIIILCFFLIGCDNSSCIDPNGHNWKEGATGWKAFQYSAVKDMPFCPTYFYECFVCGKIAMAGVPSSALRITDELVIYEP